MKWLVTETLGGDSIRNYSRWLATGGVTSVRIAPGDTPPTDLSSFSALLLTGGVDVNPARYGEPRAAETEQIREDRDELEQLLIQRVMACGKPVLGVCRGIQILNVALGGKLIQHVPAVVSEEHRQREKKDSWHAIRFTGESALARAMKGVGEVNSAHHQAVMPEAVGRDLRVTAVSGMGIVEAVEGENLLAVQWHPERLPANHPAAGKLLELMVGMCRHGP
jgi:putative glutamine amidotransferase